MNAVDERKRLCPQELKIKHVLLVLVCLALGYFTCRQQSLWGEWRSQHLTRIKLIFVTHCLRAGLVHIHAGHQLFHVLLFIKPFCVFLIPFKKRTSVISPSTFQCRLNLMWAVINYGELGTDCQHRLWVNVVQRNMFLNVCQGCLHIHLSEGLDEW